MTPARARSTPHIGPLPNIWNSSSPEWLAMQGAPCGPRVATRTTSTSSRVQSLVTLLPSGDSLSPHKSDTG